MSQVQFALERGVPALIGVMASIRLPYPSRAFDMAHCVRHENGMLWITIVRKQNIITERNVDSRTWFGIHYACYGISDGPRTRTQVLLSYPLC